jgi:hypothetical protein
MLVVLAAFAVSLLVFARRTPVQYKVWIMNPLSCAELAIPDPALIRTCLDSSSFRGRAVPLLQAALKQAMAPGTVAILADSATSKTYKRAESTKALEDYRETVVLGQFADSAARSPSARFFTAVAAVRVADLLKVSDDCASLRDVVRYLDIASRYPFRTDVGIEPDTMRLVRGIQSDLESARARATRACAQPAGVSAARRR